MGITEYSLWQDELTLLFHAQRPASEIINYTLHHSFHPPLFFFIYKLWLTLTPDSELAARLLHVLLGCLTAILPLFFQGVLEKNKSRTYSLLLMANLTLLKWSQEALVYSFVIFLVVLFILMLERTLSDNKKNQWIIILVLLIVSNYTNYFCLIVNNLYFILRTLFHSTGKDSLKKIGLLITISFLTFIPWGLNNQLIRIFLGLKIQVQNITFWQKSSNFSEEFSYVSKFIFNNQLNYLLAFFVLFGFYFELKSKSRKQVLSASGLILSYFVFMYLNTKSGRSLFIDKYFLVMIPFTLLIITNFIHAFEGKFRFILLSYFVAVNIFSYRSYNTRQGYHDYRSPVEALSNYKNGQKLWYFLFNPNWMNYYNSIYNIEDKFTVVGNRAECEYKSTIDQRVKTLVRGDIIFLAQATCLNDYLEKSLSKANYAIEKRPFKRTQLWIIK